MLKRFPSGKNHDIPDGKPLRLAHQNHFGSQCATECVYRHLPAKVKLTRSHFGKPPLTECTLRHLPCQSELAEAPRAENRKSRRKTKKVGPKVSDRPVVIVVGLYSFSHQHKSLPTFENLLLEQECYTDVELILGSGGVVCGSAVK